MRKVAIVTGGTGGIGQAVVERLRSEGFIVVSISQKSHAKNKLHSSVLELVCDISNEAEVKETFRVIGQKFSTINSLINCAGISTSRNLTEGCLNEFDRDIAVNLRGTFLCALYAADYLSEAATIVNVSSIRARTGTPSGIGYAAAKAGVISLTKSLAIQLAAKKIRVNCVVPSAVYPTRMSAHWDKAKIQRIEKSTLLGRLATPTDIANAIFFLVSDQSSFITGQCLDINGGELLNG